MSDIDGTSCYTRSQLDAAVAIAAAGAPSNGDSSEAPASSPAPLETDADAPTIRINGNNPALIQVNQPYADLGATIIAPEAETNLGIHTFVDCIATDPIAIDTSITSTHSIDYVVTGISGLPLTSTRTVVVPPPANDNAAATTPAATNNNPPPLQETVTDATTAAQ